MKFKIKYTKIVNQKKVNEIISSQENEGIKK